jgi:heme exporter protein C
LWRIRPIATASPSIASSPIAGPSTASPSTAGSSIAGPSTANPSTAGPGARRPLYGKGLRGLSAATVATMALALALVFFYAPLEAEQGFLQKIFYVHVPLAIVALGGFVLGGLLAIVHLRTREERWDMRSYVVIHMSLIFAVGTLLTGSIWAKGSWGHWWVWSEPTLVSFLIVFLLYATYQPLRFAIEDPERQARYASVFAITAGAFVPMNFIAVRLSTAYLHPRVLGSASNLPAPMALTFAVSLAAVALLFATLCKYELTAKHARAQLRALRRRMVEDVGAPVRRPRSAAPSTEPLRRTLSEGA